MLCITRQSKPVNFTYSIHDQPLEVVSSAKYLGVEISDSLSWNKHVDSAAKKGMNTIGFICRNLCSCPRNIKETCYKAFMQPVTEYASCV